jgi:protein-disulfide isomerase
MENIETKTEEKLKNKPKLNIAGSILLSAIIIALAIFFRGGTSESSKKDNSSLDLVSSVTEKDFVRGKADAEITLIEYADFSCGYCAQYHSTLIKLITESKGKIKWVYRHLPIFNLEAAVASSCVGQIGGNTDFWRYSDTLFSNREKLNTEYYLSVAKSIGIDENKFNTCVKDDAVTSVIRKEFTQNKILLGLNGTPHTILIDKNGKKFSFTDFSSS